MNNKNNKFNIDPQLENFIAGFSEVLIVLMLIFT